MAFIMKILSFLWSHKPSSDIIKNCIKYLWVKYKINLPFVFIAILCILCGIFYKINKLERKNLLLESNLIHSTLTLKHNQTLEKLRELSEFCKSGVFVIKMSFNEINNNLSFYAIFLWDKNYGALDYLSTSIARKDGDYQPIQLTKAFVSDYITSLEQNKINIITIQELSIKHYEVYLNLQQYFNGISTYIYGIGFNNQNKPTWGILLGMQDNIQNSFCFNNQRLAIQKLKKTIDKIEIILN